jgi:PAS domain S-box-containing protein
MKPEGNPEEQLGQLREENAALRALLAGGDLERELARQREEFSTLLDVSKLIVSELHLETVLQLVADKAREIVKADMVLVPMLDQARTRYSYLAASGHDVEQVRGASFPVHVGMCGWVLQNERTLLFGESSPLPMGESTTWERGQQSALLVPLFGRKKIIGGLSALGKNGGGSFSRHDLDLMTMFANQVSTAIENAQLFRQVEREIEERKQSEAAVRANEAFTRSILESVGEGLIVVDRDYRVIAANRAYGEIVHVPPADIVGRRCHQVANHTEQPCFELGEACAVRTTFETGAAANVTHVQRDPHGHDTVIEIRSFPLRDAAGAVTAAIEIINDVTERKRLETQLYQAQKMEAIGTLAGGIAHDFNNILSAIVGYSSLLQMRLGAGDPARDYVKQVLDAADKAGVLTKSLLAFSRKQIVELSPVDVNEVIWDFQKILARLIGEDIAIKVSCSPSPLIVDADKGQLEQVLMNLATNARDAMPRGGELQFSTAALEVDTANQAAYALATPGSYAYITVSDTGNGMDQRLLEHIFEPFFTTKELHKGTGLGLSIVYGIIVKHGGAIKVYSEPGHGTTFKIYLPLSRRELRPAGRDEPALLPRGRETILLVEDEENVRSVTSAVLREYGYSVIEAADGEEAVRAFREDRDRIDLVLTDLIMPKMNGREAIREMKLLRPDLKAIYTSGYTADIITQKGLLEEGGVFITKPLNPADLLRKLREVLAAEP